MSKVIWKFTFQISAPIYINMPVGARVLHVECQHGIPCMWALCDPDAATEERIFIVVGTGHPISPACGEHVATFQMEGGVFVWHVFERAAS